VARTDTTTGERPFVKALAGINRGAVLDEASLGLAALTTAVAATGRKGTLTLKVTVSPFKGNGAMVTVDADVEVKEPKQQAHGGVFFTDENGNLSRNDPHQGTLPLGDDAE